MLIKSGYKFTSQEITDFLNGLVNHLKEHGGCPCSTIYEDKEFNEDNSDSTGINGVDYLIEMYTVHQDKISDLASQLAAHCKDWSYREMYAYVCKTATMCDVEVHIELYGGLYS